MNLRRHIRKITIFVCLFWAWPLIATASQEPQAAHGVLDLREWDFQDNGSVELKGTWRIAWNQFTGNQPLTDFNTQYPHTVTMPGKWGEPGVSSDKTQSTVGYGTYALEVWLPPHLSSASFALRANSANPATRWRIYTADSHQLIGEMNQGKPGKSLHATTPRWIPATATLAASTANKIRIVMEVCNFRYPIGGFTSVPQLGLRKDVEEHLFSETFLNALTLGILMIIGWYHLVLFLQRREDKASLAFALWCGAFALRTCLTARIPQLLAYDKSPTAFEWLVALEFISIPLIGVGCAYFLLALMPSIFARRTFWAVGISGLALILITLGSSASFYAANLHIYQVHSLGSALIFFIYLFTRIYEGDKIARWVTLALVILLIGGVNDILYSQNLIETDFISHYTFIAFIVLQIAIISGKFSSAYRRAEHLSQHLQEEVTAQTASLRETSNREIQHAKTLLNQSEKLSQLGVMIATIGHEIVNPVSVISSSLDIQEETTQTIHKQVKNKNSSSPPNQTADEALEKQFTKLELTYRASRTSVNKLLEMTNALRTQSRMEDLPTKGVSINEVIKEAIVLTNGRMDIHELVQELGDLPLTNCYRSKIGQVAINLLVNAADALDSKRQDQKTAGIFYRGKIIIQTSSITRENTDGILIAVADSGTGVPQELRDKIFNQFFTTKAAGTGTGLGLAICAEIAREHGGQFYLTNDPVLGGARFELWLPNKSIEELS